MPDTDISIDDLISLIRLQLGVRDVNAEAELQADLGAESIDIQNLVTAVEQRYNLMLEDDDLERLVTVGDLHALLNDAHRSKG